MRDAQQNSLDSTGMPAGRSRWAGSGQPIRYKLCHAMRDILLGCDLPATISRRAAQSQLVIETPYRNSALLDAMLSTLQPTTKLSLSCGLTLATGWTRSDTIARWRGHRGTLPDDTPAVFCFQAA